MKRGGFIYFIFASIFVEEDSRISVTVKDVVENIFRVRFNNGSRDALYQNMLHNLDFNV